MQMPMLWIYEYIESFPENSSQRIAITDMVVRYMKELEDKENSDHE